MEDKRSSFPLAELGPLRAGVGPLAPTGGHPGGSEPRDLTTDGESHKGRSGTTEKEAGSTAKVVNFF